MLESHRIARIAVVASDENIIDGIRLIRDSLITVEPIESGGLRIASPILEGKSINEAAEVLLNVLDGTIPSQSGYLAWELIYVAGEAGNALVDFMVVHDVLDSAIEEWEQNQKHTEFLIDEEDL